MSLSAKQRPLSQVAIERLTSIALYILGHPKEYSQISYETCIAGLNTKLYGTERKQKLRAVMHLKWMYDANHDGNPYKVAAQKEMKLSDVQAERIFGFTLRSWPSKFHWAHENAKTDKGRARVVYNRIMHFIKTNGEE